MYILADHVTIIYGNCSEPICIILGKCGYLIDKDEFKQVTLLGMLIKYA